MGNPFLYILLSLDGDGFFAQPAYNGRDYFHLIAVIRICNPPPRQFRSKRLLLPATIAFTVLYNIPKFCELRVETDVSASVCFPLLGL